MVLTPRARRRELCCCGLVLAGALLASPAAGAGPTDDANATASAQIIAEIQIERQGDLSFGRLFPTGVGGTVKIDPLGFPLRTAVNVGAFSTPSPSAALFHVAGAPSQSFAITLPSSITIASGANNMTVDLFSSFPSGSGTLSAGPGVGHANINVGATLHVGASQPAGVYSNSFTVSVAYQ